MPRSVHGYVYVVPIDGRHARYKEPAVRIAGFKLDGYIYVSPIDLRMLHFRYHEDTTRDFIAFQPCRWFVAKF
jgi:hypothetical protein